MQVCYILYILKILQPCRENTSFPHALVDKKLWLCFNREFICHKPFFFDIESKKVYVVSRSVDSLSLVGHGPYKWTFTTNEQI